MSQLVSQLLPADDTRKGETISKTLSNGHNVWPDTRVFDGKVLSSPSETTLDLVNDEHDTMLVTNLSETLQELWGSRNVTTLADNRLDDDSSGIFRCRLLRKEKVELVKTECGKFLGGSFFRAGKLVPVWEGKRENAGLSTMQ